ncbi:MAG: hypothetical protein H7039_10750 [Bryobacteraceae bacterium]|nr:hypothetical protein [Bryobacteraceae bacterium]
MRFASVVLMSIVLAACTREINPAEKAVQQRNPGVMANTSARVVSPYDAGFWSTWGDGQAEVAAYDLTMPKYGQQRRGTAIAITVAEPFSKSLRVKADEGKHAASDVASAMKLNLIREYQTGVYNYKDMLSAFVWLQDVGKIPAGSATKITYSSQEWCGHVWSQLLFGPERVQQQSHSYFDGEADSQSSLSMEESGVSEDALFLVARRIAWPRLRLGQTHTARLLTSLETQRAQHIGLNWSEVELSLSRERQTTAVPAGSFRTNRFTAKTEDGLTRTFDVEADAPFRVVRWESNAGEKAELIGSARMKYWQMNAEGGEKTLAALGLTPRAARMP